MVTENTQNGNYALGGDYMQVFPPFRGITWPVTKTTEWVTVTQNAVSGKEIRASTASTPLFRFGLTFSFLTKSDYERILQFYHRVRGAKQPFLFLDKTDCRAVDQNIATGDDATKDFQLYKNMDTLKYPVKTPISIDSVKVAGIETEYTLLPDGVVQFDLAPKLNQIISASFSYYYKVRFSVGEMEYEKFTYDLWELKTLELITVK